MSGKDLLKNLGKAGDILGANDDEKKITELNTKISRLEEKAYIDLPLNALIKREPFISAYELKGSTYDAIAEDMEKNGYDKNQPIIVWKTKEGFVLIDGHRRSSIAKKNKMQTIPAFVVDHLKNDKEAKIYIDDLQWNRRSMGDIESLKYAIHVDFKSIPGKGKKKEKLARRCNFSESKAQRILSVVAKGEEFHKKILYED